MNGEKETWSWEVFVSPGNDSEALLVDRISVYVPKNLR